MESLFRMRRIVVMVMAFVISVSIDAKIVSLENAQSIATKFLKQECVPVNLSSTKKAVLTELNGKAQPEFYIFNRIDSIGFVIVAGDDAVAPILGFSLENTIDPNDIPDNLCAHLDNLRQEIDMARHDSSIKFQKANGPTSEKGYRLVTPQWNQSGFPYNALIPGNVHAGCIAASMSIIMGAWHWPECGEGVSKHKGIVGGLGLDYDITLDHNTPLFLDEIPFVYNSNTITPDQECALANLLYHTSVSVKMNYRTDASGAYMSNAADALVKNFKYASNLELYYEQSAKDIDLRLREELNAGRPVIYSAINSNSGAHAFICDGVWDDYFHFNMGWGGKSNGYYLLSAVAADDKGSGYVYNRNVITGIQPDTKCSDYTPRKVEVVYDAFTPEKEEPEVETSPDYSPVEFTTEGGCVGLASPRSSYLKGETATIYFSGYKLTGRFDNTQDAVAQEEGDVNFTFAVGIVDANGEIKAIYPRSSSSYVRNYSVISSITTLNFTPEIDILPSDRLRLYSKKTGENKWKWVRGLEGTKDELSCSASSSALLPFGVNFDTKDFSTMNAYGQLRNNVVKGQSYTFFFVPEYQMESVDMRNNGKVVAYRESIDNNTGKINYYYATLDITDDEGVNLFVRPLTKAETDVTVSTSPGKLFEELGDKVGNVRTLTIKGEVNVTDLKNISYENMPLLKKLYMRQAEIVPTTIIHPGNSLHDLFMWSHINLTEIELPESLTAIGSNALAYCYKLKRVTIPEGLTEIPTYALMFCPFEEVWNACPVPQDISSYFVSSVTPGSTLYVPEGSGDAYKAHPNWSKFSNIVEMEFGGIDNIILEESDVKVLREGSNLRVIGTTESIYTAVYTLSGMRIWSGNSDDLNNFKVPSGTPVIVKVGTRAFKFL